MKRLDINTILELEQLVIAAIYSDLITATLDPASQTVVITSVAPLRDLAPGSVAMMITELKAWSDRCDTVLLELEKEIAKVKEGAKRRNTREAKTARQVRAVVEAAERHNPGLSSTSRNIPNNRGIKRDAAEGYDEGDVMDVDGREHNGLSGTGEKRSDGIGALFGRVGGKMGR